jgi:hypothetical protein
VLLKDCRDDLWHAALLEDSLVASVCKASQAGRQGQVIARDTPAGAIAADGVNLSMQAAIRLTEVQVRGLVEQRLQVKGRVFTHHLHPHGKRLVKELAAFECQHLEVNVDTCKCQFET